MQPAGLTFLAYPPSPGPPKEGAWAWHLFPQEDLREGSPPLLLCHTLHRGLASLAGRESRSLQVSCAEKRPRQPQGKCLLPGAKKSSWGGGAKGRKCWIQAPAAHQAA